VLDNQVLLELAEKYGTPLYVYDYEIIERNFKALRKELSKHLVDFKIAYALKAAPLVDLCRFLNSMGAIFEAVSIWEVYTALKADVEPSKILFDGVSKSPHEIRKAIELGLQSIHVESLDEIFDVASEAERQRKVQNIGIRLNLDVEVETHKGLKTSTRYSKFGIPLYRFKANIEKVLGLKSISVKGLHFHLGSNLQSERPYKEALKKILELLRENEELAENLTYIDVGGGFPAKLDKTLEIASKLGVWIRNVFLNEFPGLTIIVEPGRFLVAEAGVLLTRVNYVKEIYGKKWALVDAGMNDFIRPALYGAKHNIECISCRETRQETYSIGGPICESTDVFAENVNLPTLFRGDILVLKEAGAYGISMASNYNQRPRPAVISLYKGQVKIVKKREILAELLNL